MMSPALPHPSCQKLTPGLYLAVRPIPPIEDISRLRAYLKAAFPAPSNTGYLQALLPIATSPDTSTRLRQAAARLGALSLLPALIRVAGGDTTVLCLSRDEHGRPFCSNVQGDDPAVNRHAPPVADIGLVDFNLSHSHAHIAAALLVTNPMATASVVAASETDQPTGVPTGVPTVRRVGIDVEEPVPPLRASRLLQRYATEGERAVRAAAPATESDAAYFTRLWTMREAVAKQEGRGMPLHFDTARLPSSVRLLCARLADTGAYVTVCLPTEAAPLPRCVTDDSLPMEWLSL